jgi:hypothetical protein
LSIQKLSVQLNNLLFLLHGEAMSRPKDPVAPLLNELSAFLKVSTRPFEHGVDVLNPSLCLVPGTQDDDKNQ